jgi:transcriptional regulator with XRE-family HTH domain
MGSTERAYDRGTRRGERWLKELGEELRRARLSRGISQRRVADAARISQPVYSRIERGVLPHLAVLTAARVAAVLGLELSVRAYPDGNGIRDAAHAERLGRLLAHVCPPLRYRTEVPLPGSSDHPERRSWDAALFGHGERTAVELEMRLYDAQAQWRRLNLKRRDDPPDRLLLVVAATRANRRALAELVDLAPELPRLRTASVLATLRAGRHPPSGIVLL